MCPSATFTFTALLSAETKPPASITTTATTTPTSAKPAPAAPKAKNKDDDIVEMSPFIVTAKTRGILPLVAMVRSQLFGNRITTPAIIVKSDHPAHLATLEKYGLSVGERIISIDGEKIQGMSGLSRLNELWFEGDPGRQVTLVVQGAGEKESMFRKVILTTISVARLRKIEEEWKQQHPDKAQPAAGQPDNPDKKKSPPNDSDEWKWRKL